MCVCVSLRENVKVYLKTKTENNSPLFLSYLYSSHFPFLHNVWLESARLDLPHNLQELHEQSLLGFSS